jgi:hypothetical protein
MNEDMIIKEDYNIFEEASLNPESFWKFEHFTIE